MNSSYSSSSTKTIFRSTQIIWYVLIVLEVLLAFRFFLKMFAANSAAGFSSFIYGVTWPFAQPFISVFSISKVQGSIFEWTTLLAMGVYLLVAFGIIRIFLMSKTISTSEAAAKLDKKEII